MKGSLWKIREPSWSVYEADSLVYNIRTTRPSPERSNFIKKWRVRKKANQDLKDEGIFSAEFRIRPDNENLYFRPARPFYEKYPLCKFSHSEWIDKDNDFETSERGIRSLIALDFPNIREIERGYSLRPPQSHIKRCNEKWHNLLIEEMRAVVLEELAQEGELATPEGVEEL